MTQPTDVIASLSDRVKHPHIPNALVKHARHLRKLNAKSRFLDALDSDSQATAGAINSMFETAAQVAAQTPDEVLAGTDFNWKDTSPARIDAAFAEVRTINILHTHGFTHIRQVRAGTSPAADLVGKRAGQSYAVEVADSIYYAQARFSPSQIADWIVDRYQSQGKGVQLSNTANQLGCQRRVFVAIMDTAHTVALQEASDFLSAVEAAWRRLAQEPTLHVALFTGRVSMSQGPDDSVFPAWP